MPAEWDAYLERMGRTSEIGAGANDDFALDGLSWEEIAEDAPQGDAQSDARNDTRSATGPARAASTAARAQHPKTQPGQNARVARPPEHVARAFPERARQFMPFAALKGFDEMIAEEERRAVENEAAERAYSQPDRFSPA